MAPRIPPDGTEDRLLDVAGQIFAEEGFQAAKVRDICARAGANLAAVNYHFGDKLGLYKEVVRFALCAAEGTKLLNPNLPGKTPEDKLRAFVSSILHHMYGQGQLTWPVRLMTHELAQPTPAFEGVVEQIIRPRYDALRALVAGIINRPVGHDKTRLCTQSVMGQVIIYAHGREVIKRLWPDFKFTPETMDELAAHIAAFSWGGIKSQRKPKRKSGRRKPSHD
jgi:AcrR family transcriptional regulator